MKRGDWIRLPGRKIAHFVVAEAYAGAFVSFACELLLWPKALLIVDDTAPRCKKCLKAMQIARRGRN